MPTVKMQASGIPDAILWPMQVLFQINKNQCFDNCGLATILSIGANEYSKKISYYDFMICYALGFLSPPAHDTVSHAWLVCTRKDSTLRFIWDPTLQVHSPLWNQQAPKFKYDLHHTLTAYELKEWFLKKYSDRDFTADGIPDGKCQFPIINKMGYIE